MKSGFKKAASLAWVLFILTVVLIVIRLYYQSKQIGQVPPSTPDVTVFQTSFGSFVLPIVGGLLIAFGVALVIIILRRSFQTKEFKTLRLMLIPIFLLGLGTFWAYSLPLREQIVVDESAQVISIKGQYLIRKDKDLRIVFDEIHRVKFYRHPGQMAHLAYAPPWGSVEIVMIDGTTIQISHDGINAQHNLASSISLATGKKLIEGNEGKNDKGPSVIRIIIFGICLLFLVFIGEVLPRILKRRKTH